MTTTTAPCPLPLEPAAATRNDRHIGRLIACMAAFYDNREQAQEALLSLGQLPGLAPTTTALLGPADAGALRVGRLSRQWAAPWQANRAAPRSPFWRHLGLGLLLGSALAWLWWLGATTAEFDANKTTLIWTGLLLSGALAAALIALGGGLRAPARPRRFDRQVRQALSAGSWVVVVHSLSWQAQREAVDLLRSGSGSDSWCAEPTPGARL